MGARSVPRTIDEHIESHPPETKRLLQELRALIREAAPDAVETISYGIPTFDQNGHLVHFAGHRSHIGFYPTDQGVEAFAAELAGYKTTKGSVHFPLDRPLPADLIRRIVVFRVEQNTRRTAGKARRGERGG